MPVRNQTTEVVNKLLVGVLLAGTASITVIAPNSLSALEKPLKKILDRKDRHESARIARYLKRCKLVRVISADGDDYKVELTDKGNRRAQRAHFEMLEPVTKSWDGKWRVLMFDIPERYKGGRDYLSLHLKRIGFVQMQKSVFVYPYPVDGFVAVAKEVLPEISPHLIYMTVESVDAHNSLVIKFKSILK